jgi:hypothetical protein
MLQEAVTSPVLKHWIAHAILKMGPQSLHPPMMTRAIKSNCIALVVVLRKRIERDLNSL